MANSDSILVCLLSELQAFVTSLQSCPLFLSKQGLFSCFQDMAILNDSFIKYELPLCYIVPFDSLYLDGSLVFLEFGKGLDVANYLNRSFLMRLDFLFGSVENIIFVDGSESAKSCFSAFLDFGSDKFGRFKLHDQSSIFSAEAFAILMALKYIQDCSPKETVIVSDS